jgi:hypothetical protein
LDQRGAVTIGGVPVENTTVIVIPGRAEVTYAEHLSEEALAGEIKAFSLKFGVDFEPTFGKPDQF